MPLKARHSGAAAHETNAAPALEPKDVIRARAETALHELRALDWAIYDAIADSPTPTLDEGIRRLSNTANNSLLWMGVAAGFATLGAQHGRKAAATGLVSIALSSAIVNRG